MINFGLDDEDEKEIEDQIRQTVKLTIKTIEILLEELEKSSLPQEIKDYIIKNAAITNK